MSLDDNKLKEILSNIKSNMKLFDETVYYDFENVEKLKRYVTESQAKAIQEVLDLLKRLNWQLALNGYKKLEYSEDKAIDKKGCGTPVKVRPCFSEEELQEGKEDKTYFGILLGDLPLSISHTIDKEGNLIAGRSFYNPAIFVPELNDIIMGAGSFWSKIESEEDLDKLITDEAIDNVWYMKYFKSILGS